MWLMEAHLKFGSRGRFRVTPLLKVRRLLPGPGVAGAVALPHVPNGDVRPVQPLGAAVSSVGHLDGRDDKGPAQVHPPPGVAILPGIVATAPAQ